MAKRRNCKVVGTAKIGCTEMPKVRKTRRSKMTNQFHILCKTSQDLINDQDSSEVESLSFQKPAFYVSDLDETADNFDLTIPPTSGIEYLRRVHYEAKLCPPVVVADMDTSIFKAKQTVKFSNSTGCIPPPLVFIPTLQWQNYQLRYFSRVRKRLSSYKASLAEQNEPLKPPVKLPPIKDNVGWCKLCFGTKAWMRIPSKKDKSVCTSSVETDDSAAQEEENTDAMLPLLSIICTLSQPAVEKILNYHISWMEVMGLTNQQGRWFYALLASLEMPLTPEMCSSLRTLARNCSALRAALPNDKDPRLVPLNLLICLVARFFRQTDLADMPN